MARHRTIAAAQVPRIEPVPQAELSTDAFRGLLRVLNSKIVIESNPIWRKPTADPMPVRLGETTPLQFLRRLLTEIPSHYNPTIYAHGGLATEKKLAELSKKQTIVFNDFDVLIFINSYAYEGDTQSEVSAAVERSMSAVIGNNTQIAQRAFQKRVLIDSPQHRYSYYGAIMAIGPRSGSNMIELEFLTLGVDPINSRSAKLSRLCSSSLDSLMIGPLNPLLQFEPTDPGHQNCLEGKGNPKGVFGLYREMGRQSPKKISKYYYSESDLQLIETMNIVISPGWPNNPIRLPRLASQAGKRGGIRIGSPLVIESMAKSLLTLAPADFEIELNRYLRTHFPSASDADKLPYLIGLERLIAAIATTVFGQQIPQKLDELKQLVRNHIPPKSKTKDVHIQFKFDPPSIISSWCTTITQILKESSRGQIQHDALIGMDAYLTLLEQMESGSLDPNTLPEGTPTISLSEVELRIITRTKSDPVLFTKIIPALGNTPGSLFFINRSEYPYDVQEPQIPAESRVQWLDWARSVDNPDIIPFYERLLAATQSVRPDDSTPTEWGITCDRLKRISDRSAAELWFKSALRYEFQLTTITPEWQPVIDSFSSRTSASEAIIAHAPISTAEIANTIRTLCLGRDDHWHHRLITDEKLALNIRSTEAQLALKNISENRSQPLNWNQLQNMILLLQHVTTLPNPVLEGLSSRIERKISGSKPSELLLNIDHVTKIPGHAPLLSKLFIRLSESGVIRQSTLTNLADIVLDEVLKGTITLGPVKASLRRHCDAEVQWKPRIRGLTADHYFQRLEQIIDIGVNQDTLRRILNDRAPETTIKTNVRRSVFLKALAQLKIGVDFNEPSTEKNFFFQVFGNCIKMFAHTSAAAPLFNLMDCPRMTAGSFADYRIMCDVAVQLGLTSRPKDSTDLEDSPGSPSDRLGRWFAAVRPDAVENLSIHTTSTMTGTEFVPVSRAMQSLLVDVAKKKQWWLLISMLRHALNTPHPLQASELLLRAEELYQINLFHDLRGTPEIQIITDIFKSAWSTKIVPFLYDLCKTGRFATRSFTYTNPTGRILTIPVDIHSTLQKIMDCQAIDRSTWARVNFEIAPQLLDWIDQDQLPQEFQSNALALTTSIMINAQISTAPQGRFPVIPYDEMDPIIERFIAKLLTLPRTEEHTHAMVVFFGTTIKYISRFSEQIPSPQLHSFIDRHRDFLSDHAIQKEIVTRLATTPALVGHFVSQMCGIQLRFVDLPDAAKSPHR